MALVKVPSPPIHPVNSATGPTVAVEGMDKWATAPLRYAVAQIYTLAHVAASATDSSGRAALPVVNGQA